MSSNDDQNEGGPGPALDATLASIAEAGLEHPVLDRLARKLRERAAAIGARFGG